MDAHYTWARIGKHDATESPGLEWYLQRQGKPHILDIMGAPIQRPDEFKGITNRWIEEGTTLCISGELKRYTEGSPASNYRNKDPELNDNVVDNYFHLFTHHQEVTRGKPIIVNTIPRSWRKYSWLIQEDGNIIREDQEYRRECKESCRSPTRSVVQSPTPVTLVPPECMTIRDIEDTDLKMFLDYYGIYPEQLMKIRESCKGAKYHTYLIDMISFLYQMKMDTSEFHKMFSSDYRKVTASSDEKSILSFEDTTDNKGYVFFSPNKSSVDQIYRDFELAISLEENEVKEKIRKHLLDHRIDRWTDFDANDTDDAFTIIMMIHAFKGLVVSDGHYPSDTLSYSDTQMTSEEGIILESLETIMEPWFSQLE
jgi:hypothetical protein